MLNKFKNKIWQYIKKYYQNHDIYFEIEENGNDLIFNLKNSLKFVENYLMIKNRETGKRTLYKFKNSEVKLTLTDLNILQDDGLYDIYVQVKFLKRYFLKRAKFDSQNILKRIVDNENEKLFIVCKTHYGNLSFNYTESNFFAKITKIEKINNSLKLSGEVELFNEIDFNSMNILIILENERHFIPCNYKRNNEKITFTSDLYFEISDLEMNKQKGVFIQLKSEDELFGSSLIYVDESAKLDKISKNYINYIRNPNEESVNSDLCSLFFINNTYNLAFKVLKEKSINNFIKTEIQLYEFKVNHGFDSNKQLVFFESFHGKSYSGQPKYIYEKMIELGYDKKFTFVWSYEGDLEIPGNPLVTMRQSNEYKKLLKKSTYWISNISLPIFKNKDNIIYVQTTHGTPYKKMGSDIERVNKNIKKGRVLLESDTWDYLLCANDFAKNIFVKSFEYEGEVINQGYPANDIFYKDNDEKINKLHELLNIPKNKKIVLYAPTFRDYDVSDDQEQEFELLLDLNKLYDNFKDTHVFLLRLHYSISDNLEIPERLKNFIIDVSNYDDVAELQLISDILITDYSSTFFDFAHSKKPILFYVPDLDEYSSFRGLYSEVREMLPGPEIYTNDELIDSIDNIVEISAEFKNKYDLFYEKFCSEGHGDAAEKITKIIFGDV